MRIQGALLICAAIAACARPFEESAPENAPTVNAADAGGGADANGVDAGSLSYAACPGGYSGLCAKVPMPLDWKNPEGKKVDILIDKISATPRPKAQLWLLQGGPGGTAADMVGLANLFADNIDDFELYTIEHRGVGASNRLGCPNEEAKGAAMNRVTCAEEVKASYGSDLAFYNTTNAAKDLARAIELTRRDGVKTYVYGVSYGTAWAERLMQVAPKAADAIILDSLVVPGQQFLSQFDPQADVVAQKMGELCKLDPDCSAALGSDPWGAIRATKEKFVNGYCPALEMIPEDRVAFTALLRNHLTMGYAFAAWARIERCSADDVAAIKRLRQQIGVVFNGPNARLNSDWLGINIMVSEMFEEPFPSQATFRERFENSVFPAGVSFDFFIFQGWPRYAKDEFVGKLPEPQIPVLVLSGTLDSQTPIEIQEKAKPTFSNPGSTFVTVPNGNHAIVAQSPMVAAPGTPPSQCGMKIAAQFLTAPGSALDTSCTSKVLPPSFARPNEEVGFLMGTSSMWTGAPAIAAALPLDLAIAQRRLPSLLR